MDKNLVGLIGAVSVLAMTAPAQAATGSPITVESAMQASSYTELLQPIPNALALLKARNEAASRSSDPEGRGMLEDVQLYIELPHPRIHHHHHHHHHQQVQHHHHHHHHHQQTSDREFR